MAMTRDDMQARLAQLGAMLAQEGCARISANLKGQVTKIQNRLRMAELADMHAARDVAEAAFKAATYISDDSARAAAYDAAAEAFDTAEALTRQEYVSDSSGRLACREKAALCRRMAANVRASAAPKVALMQSPSAPVPALVVIGKVDLYKAEPEAPEAALDSPERDLAQSVAELARHDGLPLPCNASALPSLRAARLALGMSQAEAGRLISVTQSGFARIESGASALSAASALILCQTFGLTLAELLSPTV